MFKCIFYELLIVSRDFLLFAAPVVFYNVMEKQYYDHLMLLIDSTQMLLYSFDKKDLEIAKSKVNKKLIMIYILAL